jgi:hypothetical protein
MSDSDASNENSVHKVFEETLNTHGYSFQYAVVELIEQLRIQSKSYWYFERAEVPVDVRGPGTRIDFVLSRLSTPYGQKASQYQILAECKRTNPVYSDWCFVRAPYVKLAPSAPSLVLKG